MGWGYLDYILAILYLYGLTKSDIMKRYVWLVFYYVFYDTLQTTSIIPDLVITLLFIKDNYFKQIASIVITNSVITLAFKYYPFIVWDIVSEFKLFYLDLIFWAAIKEVNICKQSTLYKAQVFAMCYLYFSKGIF